MPDQLPDDYLRQAEHRARVFSGAWTGTAGTLAADVMRLLAERKQLVQTIAVLRARIEQMA